MKKENIPYLIFCTSAVTFLFCIIIFFVSTNEATFSAMLSIIMTIGLFAIRDIINDKNHQQP